MIYKVNNGILEVKASSSGAELAGIKRIDSGIEYLWQGDPAFWARRAPMLFPIVGRLINNHFKYEGKEYELSQHGFARDMEFSLVAQNKNSLSLKLSWTPETLKIYPFKFELLVSYALEGKALIVSNSVRNTDNKTIWFSIGAHPGFNCPLEKDEKFEDYSIVFEKNEEIERHFLKNGLFDGRKEAFLQDSRIVQLSNDLFKDDAVILKGLKSQSVVLKGGKSKKSVKIEFNGFPYLGIWSKPGAPFVCIEPWFGIASSANGSTDINEKEGILSLEPGKTFSCVYKIVIS